MKVYGSQCSIAASTDLPNRARIDVDFFLYPIWVRS